VISSFQVFTQIYLMTQGGPIDKTTTMVYYIYQWAFKFFDLGYASTLAMALFVLLLAVTLLQLHLYRRADA
jgi:multiple sugar transport system permease protein